MLSASRAVHAVPGAPCLLSDHDCIWRYINVFHFNDLTLNFTHSPSAYSAIALNCAIELDACSPTHELRLSFRGTLVSY